MIDPLRHVTTRVTKDTTVANHVIGIVVDVSVNPKLQLRVVEHDIAHVRSVLSIHMEVIRILRRNAQVVRRMMRDNDDLAIIWFRELLLQKRLELEMLDDAHVRMKLASVVRMANVLVVVDLLLNRPHRHWIAFVDVRPHSPADDLVPFDLNSVVIEKDDIWRKVAFTMDTFYGAVNAGLVVFVVADDIDDERESRRHAF